MKINFKQPKYVLPIVILPFLCLFFYVYQSSVANSKDPAKPQVKGMQENIGGVSTEIQKRGLDDKLDAYRDQYKEADGYTAVNSLNEETSGTSAYGSKYSNREKFMLDSIDRAMHQKQLFSGNERGYDKEAMPFASGPSSQKQAISRLSKEDQALSAALANLSEKEYIKGTKSDQHSGNGVKEKDPMEIFKAQMAYMDSVGKSNDPEYKQEMQRQIALNKADEFRKQQTKLGVQKADAVHSLFNTITPSRKETFIMAIIDEDLTGYAGSRIRIRLLDDIKVGTTLVTKGSYLYARINGFSEQRVTLSVQSILMGNKILAVKLDIYDMDGLSGLYVPESAFREFTKDLGGNSMQGVNLQGSSQNQNQFIMSTVDKVFQSTSSAIASLIRKNKAKIKYNSFIYLIDSEELQNSQKNY